MKILKTSVTKLVLLLIVLTIMFITIRDVVKGNGINQVFNDVAIMVTSYYFAQKGIKYTKPDSIVEEETLDYEWNKDGRTTNIPN